MFKKIFRHMSWAFGITSAIFAFVSDSIFKKIFIIFSVYLTGGSSLLLRGSLRKLYFNGLE